MNRINEKGYFVKDTPRGGVEQYCPFQKGVERCGLWCPLFTTDDSMITINCGQGVSYVYCE